VVQLHRLRHAVHDTHDAPQAGGRAGGEEWVRALDSPGRQAGQGRRAPVKKTLYRRRLSTRGPSCTTTASHAWQQGSCVHRCWASYIRTSRRA
jgi:hypothetical protein